ncbi:MAG TPA: S1/P1 nuclease [Pyrinomonadaceae bacterium]|nr:S1/P1 nuclease [Pyrinomonadaceae bacterium]
MKNPIIKFLLVSLLLFAFAFPAFAWDDSGHKLVAYIAWQQMSPEAREKAIKILLNAPEDSQLNALYPTPPDEDFTTYPIGARSKAAKQRDYFMIVAYWADIVRNRKYEKRYKYHHGTWHYLDTYWRESNGKIETLPEMENDKENVVERLFEFDKVLRSDAKDAEKAIALAWILHLSGDVHQPLHASGRVTSEEPKGDQGGNTFLLTPKDAKVKENLHWFWDSIVVRTVPRKADASDAEYLLPIGNAIMKKYPLTKMQNRLEPGKFDAWQQESFKIASTRLYPKTLIRNQMPSAAYNKMAFGIAEEQIALAGYRLGTLLNQIFGGNVAEMADSDNNVPCKIIRKVPYPVTQTNPSSSKTEIALLNLCPQDKGMMARPMTSLMINGAVKMFEYDVDRVFKTERAARDYAAKNGVKDVSF